MDAGMRKVVYIVAIIIIAGLFAQLIQSKQRDSYFNRALIANIYASASQIKLSVEEYFYEHGELPNSNYSLDLPEPYEFQQQGLNAISIESGGVIHIEIAGNSPQSIGHIFLIPKQLKDHLNERWLCLTPSYPGIEKWMPMCKYEPVDGW